MHTGVIITQPYEVARGLTTWFDEDRMEGDIPRQMAEGLRNSHVVACFLTKTYMKKVSGANEADNCRKEWKLALMRHTASHMLAVPMEADLLDPREWADVVALELGHALYPAAFAVRTGLPTDQEFETALDALGARILQLCEEPRPVSGVPASKYASGVASGALPLENMCPRMMWWQRIPPLMWLFLYCVFFTV